MLYLFSGRPRKNSIAAWLRKLSKKLGVTVQVEMVDIQVRPHLDVTLSKVRDFLLSKISTGQYFAILLSPPCSTFSRAPWANKKGPRPVRSFVFPRGFTRMTWSERKRTDWGNVLADFSFQAFATHAASNPEGMEAFENPEDLGAVKTGEHQGVRPSSMWQWPDFDMLLLQEDTTTAAFYQQDFGTEYLKPTRLLLRNFRQLPEFFVEGKPLFDEQGYYAGPLESRQATKQLIGFSAGQFQTTGTEQWPSQMCEWMALQILQGFMARQNAGQNTTVTADEGEITQDTDVFPISKPDGRKLVGGMGEPQFCQAPGKSRAFHDGAGLASMGRWDVEKRIWSQSSFWKVFRQKSLDLVCSYLAKGCTLDRVCFEMAVKGESGCALVKNEELKESLRKLWVSLLKERGCAEPGLDQIAEGQPFYLKLMRELLAMCEDPDREFLLQGEVGFPVGILKPLPRTPHIYEEQTAWKLEEDPFMKGEVWRNNYESVQEHEVFVREHFEQECAEGLMEKISLDEAKRRYGERVAISSLAVLVEDAELGKKRIIHDATHGTKLNHRIKCRDKTRSPGAREKQYLLAYYRERKKALVSLVGDISKAHRRFLHDPEERGLLACRVKETDPFIYINNCGTFGVASASYWWGRISGAGIRLVHEMLGPERPVELLIFADDLESLGADSMGRQGIVLTFLYMSALGFPFKWAKQRGGLKVEWIGLFTDYSSFKLGLSPKRATWMRNWVLELANSGKVTQKVFEQGLGRLGFSASALLWERPFLGPLYSWNAAVRGKKGVLKIPAMLRAILLFLAERIEDGGDLHSPPPLAKPAEEHLLFFTDAKATEVSAWIGGYKQSRQGVILEWFSEEIDREWAPWIFLKRDPKRIIASLELLASLVAVKLWGPKEGQRSSATCFLRGKTDNQSNTYALSRWMSTKFPLTLLIMELSETLRQGRCELGLDWIRRDFNELADDLTNNKFEKFEKFPRVRWLPKEERWLVLERFMKHAQDFHAELARERQVKRELPKKLPKAKRQKLEKW